MECTGAPAVVRDSLGSVAPDGIVCLVGVSSPGHDFNIDIGDLNRLAGGLQRKVEDRQQGVFTFYGNVHADRANGRST